MVRNSVFSVVVALLIVAFAATGAAADVTLTFEEFVGFDTAPISTFYANISFESGAGGSEWVARDATSNNYNVSSWPSGTVWNGGYYWIYDLVCTTTALDYSGNDGIIRFMDADATYVELGYTSGSTLWLMAYDINDNLIDQDSGPANRRYVEGNESGPGTLRVDWNGSDHIAYVVVHDSGNFWVVDNITTDASVRILTCDIYVPDDYPTIKAAVAAAENGDTICVRDGIYDLCKLYWPGKAITLRSENGPDNCIIDLDGCTGFIFYRGETSDTVIDGFTIINGYTSSWGPAVWCLNSSPTISNCVIADCVANKYGGAIFLWNSSATVADCVIQDNVAGYGGGGIFMSYSSPTIDGCAIVENAAGYAGGGLYCSKSSPTITDCVIESNMPDDIYGCTP